jgi:hypothetical protein
MDWGDCHHQPMMEYSQASPKVTMNCQHSFRIFCNRVRSSCIFFGFIEGMRNPSEMLDLPPHPTGQMPMHRRFEAHEEPCALILGEEWLGMECDPSAFAQTEISLALRGTAAFLCPPAQMRCVMSFLIVEHLIAPGPMMWLIAGVIATSVSSPCVGKRKHSASQSSAHDGLH